MVTSNRRNPPARKVDSKRLLTSHGAARLLGVGTTTIKRWADDGRLASTTTAGGHRRFERADVERMREDGRLSGVTSARGKLSTLLRTAADSHLLLGSLYDARGRLGSWWRVADELEELITDLGSAWADGELSIAGEHRATRALAYALSRCAEQLPRSTLARTCRLATAADDPHTLGLSLAELCAREVGWWCDWVGGPTPTDALVSDVAARPPDMLVVSASSHCADPAVLAETHRELAAVCRAHDVILVVGGRGAWPSAPTYGYRLDGFADFYALVAES